MTLPAPYYLDASVALYHGDALELFPLLAPQADVLVTDPPYGINFQGRWETSPEPIQGDRDLSARDSALGVWGARPALVFGSWRMPRPTAVRALLIWDKGTHVGIGDCSIPWKPNTEEIYVLGHGFIGHRGSSVLSIPAPVSWVSCPHGRAHPNEKPVALLIALITKCPLGVVIDPFAGSGTGLRAAKDLGRRAIGIEIEERYCEIAANRLRQEALPLGGAA